MSDLTPKQEKFAQLYIELGDASAAYRGAYDCARMKPQTINRNAHELLKNSKIAARIDGLRADVVHVHHVTVGSILEELEEARLRALAQDTSSSAAVAASMGKAKLAGLILDRSKVEGSLTVQNLPPLSPLAAEALKAKLEAEKF